MSSEKPALDLFPAVRSLETYGKSGLGVFYDLGVINSEGTWFYLGKGYLFKTTYGDPGSCIHPGEFFYVGAVDRGWFDLSGESPETVGLYRYDPKGKRFYAELTGGFPFEMRMVNVQLRD